MAKHFSFANANSKHKLGKVLHSGNRYQTAMNEWGKGQGDGAWAGQLSHMPKWLADESRNRKVAVQGNTCSLSLTLRVLWVSKQTSRRGPPW